MISPIAEHGAEPMKRVGVRIMPIRRWNWVAREFKGLDLGDDRLNERCRKLVTAIGRHPDKSIPQSCGDWAAAKGAYRFFDHEDVNRKLLLVQPLTGEGKDTGGPTIAVDSVDAGVGDHVLVVDEGNSAAQVLDRPRGPIRTVVVGVVDEVARG